jgi:hypothetical protein
MVQRTQNDKPTSRPLFKVGDRVRVLLGPQSAAGTIVEDRGLLGSGGRQRIYGIKVDFDQPDQPNVTYIELPEGEILGREPSGKHDSRTLETGETVHLTMAPGGKWRITAYDWSWFEGQHLGARGERLGPKELKVVTVFAQNVGWENLRFDTKDEAYAFVEKQIRAGKVEGSKLPKL